MKGNTLNLTKIKPEIFSIYPNPTDGIFQFNATDNKILNVSIFDVQGRVLKSYNNPNQNSVFDVLGYTDGVYLVNVTLMNGSISTYKIIKK
jgi:hypothetical protein